MTDEETISLLIAEHLCRVIEKEIEGAKAYIVGGAVRGLVTGQKIKDVDIAINTDVENLLGKIEDLEVIEETGKEWGSCKVRYLDTTFDVTRFRCEEEYIGGKLVAVEGTSSMLYDALRRDFGINTGYLRINEQGEFIIEDPLDRFWESLTNTEIAFVGKAQERIEEDPCRMLRAFRLSAQLGWRIEDESLLAIKDNAELIDKVSVERIRAELDLILLVGGDRLYNTFITMYEIGLLSSILPELHFAMTANQNKHHAETIGVHLLLTASAIRKDNLLLRWAALLHDIAKLKVRKFSKKKDDYIFHNHEVKSAFMAKQIMRRFKFSNSEIDYVFRVILHHMFFITDKTKISTVRRFMFRAGRDVVRDVLRLRIADRIGNLAKENAPSWHLLRLVKMVRQVEKEEKIMRVTDLKVNGHDMMRHGLHREEVGKCLDYLLERCVSNPKNNVRRKLLAMTKKWVKENK